MLEVELGGDDLCRHAGASKDLVFVDDFVGPVEAILRFGGAVVAQVVVGGTDPERGGHAAASALHENDDGDEAKQAGGVHDTVLTK